MGGSKTAIAEINRALLRSLPASHQPAIAVMEITAAVVPEKFAAFTIDKLELTDPRPDEALVRIVASGMCQTDLHGRDGYYDTPYPAVYGHEGPGIVETVGRKRDEIRTGRSRRPLVSVVR